MYVDERTIKPFKIKKIKKNKCAYVDVCMCGCMYVCVCVRKRVKNIKQTTSYLNVCFYFINESQSD